MPEQTRDLDERLIAYLKTVNAQMAVANPQYDPSRKSEARKGGSRRNTRNKGGQRRRREPQE